MLRLKNINTYYGKVHALKNVSLHLAEGEIVTLIGANGAGKTTILNTISGVTPAAAGEVIFGKQPVDCSHYVMTGQCSRTARMIFRRFHNLFHCGKPGHHDRLHPVAAHIEDSLHHTREVRSDDNGVEPHSRQ